MINLDSTCSRARGTFALPMLLCLATLSLPVAATAEPDTGAAVAQATLERLSKDMVAGLQDPSVRQNVNEIRDLVERVLVPHIDFRVSSNLVLGPHWADASESQRTAFIDEFRSFLVRFYVGALASYVDSSGVPTDVMTFEDEPKLKNERQLTVFSKVGQANGDKVPVEYRFFLRESWKIIDVSVAGISMVQSYRSNFTSTVKNKGLDVLIAQLHERNLSFRAN
jgi:phospholipid transport system substrate-binding protein